MDKATRSATLGALSCDGYWQKYIFKFYQMQYSLLDVIDDRYQEYEGQKIMIGLSGGINSAAVLAYLATQIEYKPETLYLFHANFKEHSDDTLDFVKANVAFAEKHFDNVVYEQDDICLLDFFEEQKTIFAPKFSGCTRMLKVIPMMEFMVRHGVKYDLVGYVRSEMSRVKRQMARKVAGKSYPIRHLSNEDCFSIVENTIGWYPAIYHLKWNDERILPYLDSHGHLLRPQQRNIIRKYAVRGYGYSGSPRVFKHNNCLPCKNMHQWELFMVKMFFPDHHLNAMNTAAVTGSYWGRSPDDHSEVDTTCTVCAA